MTQRKLGMATTKSSLASQRQGQIGINVVERIVLAEWGCRWQPLEAQNDDGIDGLIFIERGGEATGQIVFAQVKCTASPITGERRRVPISPTKLRRNVQRWRRVVGAAILIHVDPSDEKATWVNLRDQSAIGHSQVFVRTDNHFDRSAKAEIAQLCGSIHRDVLLPQVDTTVEDFSHMKSRSHLQSAARQLYRTLDQDQIRLGGNGPVVRFTRDGWKHITRRGRSHLSQVQSFILLGAVRRILEQATENGLSREKTGDVTTFVTRAAVTFPFRQTAVVKIVLRRLATEDHTTQFSFLTIYEAKRKRNVLGARGPLSLQAT